MSPKKIKKHHNELPEIRIQQQATNNQQPGASSQKPEAIWDNRK
jgi:hypothetical protein